MMKLKAAALIAAGGSSSRAGRDKLFAEIGGLPVIIRTVISFERAESIDEIIIASRAESVGKIKELCERHGISKLKAVVAGDSDRQGTVLNAIAEVSDGVGLIAVHDGARPFIRSQDIDEIVRLAWEKGAVIPAVRVRDTIKIAEGGRVIATPDRDGLYAAQTPQAFLLPNYLKALKTLRNTTTGSYPAVTDDAMLFELAGIPVHITEGDERNIKITTSHDLTGFATLRIGTGYDVHRFAEARRLILCGVEIPHEYGLLGHSDADVAVHALMDALLGAAALGDIGGHFPPTAQEFKDISSLELLGRVMKLIGEEDYTPGNIDITIIAEKPRLAPYILQMREKISQVCGLPLGSVSVKATTEEGLGLAGKGIGANAVCTLSRI